VAASFSHCTTSCPDAQEPALLGPGIGSVGLAQLDDELLAPDQPPHLGDAEVRVDSRAIDLGRRHVDLDRQVGARIVDRVLRSASQGFLGHPDLLGVKVVGQVRLEAADQRTPRRLAAAQIVEVPAHRDRLDDHAEQFLESLVEVARDHDLQVPPIIDQADRLALACSLRELAVGVPVDSREQATLIAALDPNGG
jgi:hypothetical protein